MGSSSKGNCTLRSNELSCLNNAISRWNFSAGQVFPYNGRQNFMTESTKSNTGRCPALVQSSGKIEIYSCNFHFKIIFKCIPRSSRYSSSSEFYIKKCCIHFLLLLWVLHFPPIPNFIIKHNRMVRFRLVYLLFQPVAAVRHSETLR
jgi:hypothetical protein